MPLQMHNFAFQTEVAMYIQYQFHPSLPGHTIHTFQFYIHPISDHDVIKPQTFDLGAHFSSMYVSACSMFRHFGH